MGKDKTTTTEMSQTGTTSNSGSSSSGIDQGSQDFINAMRALTQRGVGAVEGGGPLVAGETEAFSQGLGALQQLMGQAGGYQGMDFNQDVRALNPNIGNGLQGDPNAALQQFNPQVGGNDNFYNQWLASQGGNPGGIGFGATAFRPEQAQAFMSPYEDQVVGSINTAADRQREAALSRAASEATAAGAFGGSRSAMLQSQALRDVNQDEAALVAQTRDRGFQQAMQTAFGAHNANQVNSLQAAIAGQQGRLQAGQLGLQAGSLNQAGQIAQGQLGLGRAEGLQRGELAVGQLNQAGQIAQNDAMTRRAQALQAGDLSSAQVGLQGLQMGGSLANSLLSGGELQRQAQTQGLQGDLFKYASLLGLMNQGYGGPLGQTNTYNQQGSATSNSTQKNTQKGDLFGDLLGAGLTIGGMFLGGPAGAAAGSALGGGAAGRAMQGAFSPGMLAGNPTQALINNTGLGLMSFPEIQVR